ncbi:glycosyltransferase [Candidatus Babeliales bacterium]|nr:glycosyltransferase [Candidatus Babeliales bacterium]
MQNPIISVVLGSYNRLKFLTLTIESITKELINFPHEIIIVDGGSNDGTIEWLLKQKNIITIIQHNKGKWKNKKITPRSWGYFMNLGFKCTQGKYVCMLSDDCLVIPGAIKNGYELFEKELKKEKKIGAVAFYFRNWSIKKKYHVSTPLGNKIYVNHGLYLKKALIDVGFIDEKTFAFYCADIDLCFKIWNKGYECISSENSYIEHYPHANLKTRKKNIKKATNDLIAFRNKWQNIFTEIDNHNVGFIKEKEYFDKYLTAEKFNFLHKKTIRENKKYFQPPTLFQIIYSTIRWKCKMMWRKIKTIFLFF